MTGHQRAARTGVLCLVALLATTLTALGSDYYASSNGTSGGAGTLASPWDLKTALSKSSSIHAGDTLWLRGGTYTNPPGKIYSGQGTDNAIWRVTLAGNSTTTIKVRPYPGEYVKLDGSLAGVSNGMKNIKILSLECSYVWLMNLELTNSDPQRMLLTAYPSDESNRPDRRGNSIDDYGPGNQIINCIIRDTGQGIGTWAQASSSVYYGNLIYNNGWAAPDRGHGHGSYAQNSASTSKLYTDNIFLPQFGELITTYGSEQATVRNFTFTGNALVQDNMTLGGGGQPNNNMNFDQNCVYNTTLGFGYGSSTGTGCRVAGNYLAGGLSFTGRKSVTVTDNWVWNPNGVVVGFTFYSGYALTDYTFDRNTYYRGRGNDPIDFWISYPTTGGRLYKFNAAIGWPSYPSWQALGYDPNSTYVNDTVHLKPTGLKYFIRPNTQQAGRANIYIYNWDQTSSVNVNISSVGLEAGDAYELRYAANYFSDVVTGTYNGNPNLSITMTGHAFQMPLGYADVVANKGMVADQGSINSYLNYLAAGPSPQFGVFVLIRTASVPPKVTSANYDYSSAVHKLVLQFSKDVSPSLGTGDVQVQNLTSTLPVTVSTLSYDAGTNTATVSFTPPTLGNGNHRATLLAAGISDAPGNALDGDGNGVGGDNYTFDFFFLAGDANHDRSVDITDLGIVGTNWQQSPRTWTQGDFTYDALVDIADLGIVGSNWQSYLAGPPGSAGSEAVAPAPVKTSGKGRLKR